jgi:hypothetical protein
MSLPAIPGEVCNSRPTWVRRPSTSAGQLLATSMLFAAVTRLRHLAVPFDINDLPSLI